MNKPKLVVFDCDGVMFDSRDANRRYYNDLLAHFGHREMDAEELDYVHIHNVMDSVAHIFRHYPAEEVAAAHAHRQTNDYTPYLQYMTMEPDLVEFLQYLRPEIHTAISTNRTTTMATVMDLFGLVPYFEMVVTALDVPRPKPHADALLNIMDRFGVTADQAIFIGDSTIDKEHAASVDMPFIAFRNEGLAAPFHVDRFMEIVELPFFQDS